MSAQAAAVLVALGTLIVGALGLAWNMHVRSDKHWQADYRKFKRRVKEWMRARPPS